MTKELSDSDIQCIITEQAIRPLIDIVEGRKSEISLKFLYPDDVVKILDSFYIVTRDEVDTNGWEPDLFYTFTISQKGTKKFLNKIIIQLSGLYGNLTVYNANLDCCEDEER